MPTTVNWEFQYVQLTACTIQSPADSTTRWMSSSTSEWSLLLEVDDQPTVVERLPGSAVGDTAGDLVGEQEAEPDPELEQEVAPAARKRTAGPRHRCR